MTTMTTKIEGPMNKITVEEAGKIAKKFPRTAWFVMQPEFVQGAQAGRYCYYKLANGTLYVAAP